MAQFKPFDDRVEVLGAAVSSFMNGISPNFKAKILEILGHNGINNPQVDVWYSQKAWLQSFLEISNEVGGSTLFAIGKAILDSAVFPPNVNDLKAGLASIDIAYQMNHRGGEIGYYKLVEFDELARIAKMECKNPYPCDFDRGIITSVVRRFKPFDSIHTLVELESNDKSRKFGAEESVYIIKW